MKNSTRILVIGATGLLGLVVARSLLHQPKVVKAIGFGPNDEPTVAAMARSTTRAEDSLFGRRDYSFLICLLRSTTLCTPATRLTLLIERGFTLTVAQSRVLGAMLFYEDTVSGSLVRDSIGVRLIGAEGAVSVQPTEVKYSRVARRMGPWQWSITPMRAGDYSLLLEFVRLPPRFRTMLNQANGIEMRLPGGGEWEGTSGPSLGTSNVLHVHVLTTAGFTAKDDARLTLASLIAGLAITIGTILKFLFAKTKERGTLDV